MKLERTSRFKRDYRKTPQEIQIRVKKTLRLLVSDLAHPSLHAKKYDESRDIWQARVNESWRIHFQIQNDVIYLLQLYNPKN